MIRNEVSLIDELITKNYYVYLTIDDDPGLQGRWDKGIRGISCSFRDACPHGQGKPVKDTIVGDFTFAGVIFVIAYALNYASVDSMMNMGVGACEQAESSARQAAICQCIKDGARDESFIGLRGMIGREVP